MWLLSLCKLAQRKAELLEASALAIRRANWLQVIGVKAEKGSTKQPTPTRAAYRYVRGTDGWVTSPLGDCALNDAVEGEASTATAPPSTTPLRLMS